MLSLSWQQVFFFFFLKYLSVYFYVTQPTSKMDRNLQCEMGLYNYVLPSAFFPRYRSVGWSMKPLPSSVFSTRWVHENISICTLVPETFAIMHFFHEMGWWKYFGLIGNALLYLFSGYIYFFINIPKHVFWILKDWKMENRKY